jgi:hypothetical protein
VPQERSHLQERSTQAEMDNVLREEGTRLSNLANGNSAKHPFYEPIDHNWASASSRLLVVE